MNDEYVLRRVRCVPLRSASILLAALSVWVLGCKQQAAPPADHIAADRLSEGKAYLSQGETDEAIKIFSTMIDGGSQDPEVLVARAAAYGKRQQFLLQAADYTRAIELKPDQVEWRLNRAIAYEAQNELDLAAADCSEVIQMAPDNAAAFALRAAMSIQQGKLKFAIEDCNQALLLRPHAYAAYSNRGLALFKLGRLPEAIADFTKALEFNNTNFEAYLNRGACYSQLGQTDRALADWTAAIELRPAANLAHTNRADLSMRLNRFADAIADYTILIDAVEKMPALRSADPRLARASLAKLYFQRGTAYLQNGSAAEALGDAKKSAAMGGDGHALDALRASAEKQLASQTRPQTSQP